MAGTKRKTYHHGDLEAAAIKTAARMVAAEGHEALSLRQLAQALGVTHRSLYNHFENREALLDAVAITGFHQLAEAVEPANDRAAFIAAYVGFARTNANLYRLMMSRPHGTMKDNPPLQSAVHRVITKAFQFWTDPAAPSPENRRRVMRVFMLFQGALALHASGILDVEDDTALIAELAAMTDGL